MRTLEVHRDVQGGLGILFEGRVYPFSVVLVESLSPAIRALLRDDFKGYSFLPDSEVSELYHPYGFTEETLVAQFTEEDFNEEV